MERKDKMEKRKGKNGWLLKAFTGIAAMILFRYFRAGSGGPKRDLVGERSRGKDSYTGQYWAECKGVTGRDVVFGGRSGDTRRLYVSGYVFTDSGRAEIRIRMNGNVTELETDEDGYFETELSLGSGGNYIVVRYEDFAGMVRLISREEKK